MIGRLLHRLLGRRTEAALSSRPAGRRPAPAPPPPAPVASQAAAAPQALGPPAQRAPVPVRVGPPPPPPPARLAGPAHFPNGEVQLVLEDGSVVALPRHPDLQAHVAYLTKNILPSQRGPGHAVPVMPPGTGPVHLVFEDGSTAPLSNHRGIESEMIAYLAYNILPGARR